MNLINTVIGEKFALEEGSKQIGLFDGLWGRPSFQVLVIPSEARNLGIKLMYAKRCNILLAKRV